MSKSSRHLYILIIFIGLVTFLYACSNLGKAKGSVVDVITHKPVSGAQIVATASSDIESEQKHLRYTTVTDKDGHFVIKGLRQKHYNIRVNKNGYTNVEFGVTIPKESAKLIKNPIIICPLPPEKGLFVYTNKFLKLEKAKPYSLFKNSGLDFAYYKWADLKKLSPTKAKFIVKYGGRNVSMKMRHPHQ